MDYIYDVEIPLRPPHKKSSKTKKTGYTTKQHTGCKKYIK